MRKTIVKFKKQQLLTVETLTLAFDAVEEKDRVGDYISYYLYYKGILIANVINLNYDIVNNQWGIEIL